MRGSVFEMRLLLDGTKQSERLVQLPPSSRTCFTSLSACSVSLSYKSESLLSNFTGFVCAALAGAHIELLDFQKQGDPTPQHMSLLQFLGTGVCVFRADISHLFIA